MGDLQIHVQGQRDSSEKKTTCLHFVLLDRLSAFRGFNLPGAFGEVDGHGARKLGQNLELLSLLYFLRSLEDEHTGTMC